MTYIRLKDVSKEFRGKVVVDNISIEIKKGSFVSIVGKYGTGKTTILKIIAGILAADSGTILIDGKPPTFLREQQRVGFAFQNPMLLPWRTVLENIALPCELSGKKYEEEAQRLLQLVGLNGKSGLKPHELSGGMQRMVSILRAAVLDPAVLILDEPFSSIDEISRDDLHEKLIDIHSKSCKTTIMVTHSIHEAVYMSDEIFVLGNSPATIIEKFKPHKPRVCDSKFSQIAMDQVAKVRKILQGGHI